MLEFKSSIIIIGKISSGKSTLAKQISNELNFPIASFGGYLLNYSRTNGLKLDRDSLQNLGDSFIKSNALSFLENVVNFSVKDADNAIFEGVRHKSIFDLIKKMSSNSQSIYLDVSDQLRLERFINRNKEIDSKSKAIEDFYNRSSHHVEKEIDSLRGQCDLIISGDEDLKNIIQQITN